MSNYNMHSFKSKPTNKSVMSPIKFILLASVVLNTSGNTSIGLNCSFPNTMDPPAGFQFVLKSCPSQVHFNARYLCRIPDLSRCDLSCPGQCSKNDATWIIVDILQPVKTLAVKFYQYLNTINKIS